VNGLNPPPYKNLPMAGSDGPVGLAEAWRARNTSGATFKLPPPFFGAGAPVPTSTGKIGTVEEFVSENQDYWLLLEVLEVNEFDEPTIGRLLAKNTERSVIIADFRKSRKKDVCIMFAGDLAEDVGAAL